MAGLSGSRAPGEEGVGKSCLCSRLVRPKADEYSASQDDHSSVYTHREFQQSIINGDHFLYHGSGERRFPANGNMTVDVHVVEHTEILDGGDTGNRTNPQPFTPPNYKTYDDRVLTRSLTSSGKRAYRSHAYTARGLTSLSFPAEFRPTHYVLVLDPTTSLASYQRQKALVARLCSSMGKRCEKAVLAITKCDKLADDEVMTKEREYEGLSSMFQVPVICVSAHKNINIDELVLQLVSRGSKSAKGITIPSYTTSSLNRSRMIEDAQLALARLMKRRVLKFELEWKAVQVDLHREASYCHLCNLAGTDAARAVFQERLLEIKLDAVKALVREEAKQANKDDYGAIAAHLLVQKADDIKLALSEHPEFA